MRASGGSLGEYRDRREGKGSLHSSRSPLRFGVLIGLPGGWSDAVKAVGKRYFSFMVPSTMFLILDEKGRITLPGEVREALGVVAGDFILLERTDRGTKRESPRRSRRSSAEAAASPLAYQESIGPKRPKYLL